MLFWFTNLTVINVILHGLKTKIFSVTQRRQSAEKTAEKTRF